MTGLLYGGAGVGEAMSEKIREGGRWGFKKVDLEQFEEKEVVDPLKFVGRSKTGLSVLNETYLNHDNAPVC